MATYRQYRFGDFRLVPDLHTLFNDEDGSALPIRPMPLALLVYLLNNHGKQIKRKILCSGVWSDGKPMSAEALNQHFTEIHRLLNEHRGDPQFILRKNTVTRFLKTPIVTDEEVRPQPLRVEKSPGYTQQPILRDSQKFIGGESPRRCNFILCGMTIQQAGEVLYNSHLDTQTTRRIRPLCRHTYIRALEDLAIAVVLGNCLYTAASFPAVGREFPGAALMESSPLRAIYRPVANTKINLDALWRTDEFRKSVNVRLADFTNAFRGSSAVFHHWLIREAVSTFDSFAEHERTGGRNQGDRDYWTDEAAEMSIPDKLVRRLAEFINSQASIPITPTLISFVRRNIVNLVVIGKLYDESSREEGRVRIPNVARAHLLIQRSSENEMIPNNILRRMSAGILDRALRELGSRPAEELPEVLLTMRQRPIWARLASSFGEITSASLTESYDWSSLESVLFDKYSLGEAECHDVFTKRNAQVLRVLQESIEDDNYHERLNAAFSEL